MKSKTGGGSVRTFENFPDDSICPVCNTNENKECILLPIDNTTEGNICQEKVIHVDCLSFDKFRFVEEGKIIYHKCKD
jgi:hypothetical protein